MTLEDADALKYRHQAFDANKVTILQSKGYKYFLLHSLNYLNTKNETPSYITNMML